MIDHCPFGQKNGTTTSSATASPSITETKLLCLAGEFGVHRN
jgi:hypothetical protein